MNEQIQELKILTHEGLIAIQKTLRRGGNGEDMARLVAYIAANYALIQSSIHEIEQIFIENSPRRRAALEREKRKREQP